MELRTQMKPPARGIASMAALAAAISVASPVWAQDADDAEADANEIVVTALKNNVTAQDAPVTINIVPGERLEERSVTSVEQLTTAVPGVRIQQAPQGSIVTTVRGLGSSPSTNVFDQTVGLFIDGVYAGHGRDYASALFDVDRIELLKGTQGATVGRSTSMGAMALVTNRPEFELGGTVSVYHEFNLDTTTFNAAVNIPLSEIAALRIAGVYSDEGGWLHNDLVGEDWPQVKRRGIRVSLRLRPTEDLDWTISAQHTSQRDNGQYFRVGADTATNTARTLAGLFGDPAFTIAPYVVRSSPRLGTAASPAINYRGLTAPGLRSDAAWRFASNLSYDAGPVTISSVTGYSQYDDTSLTNGSALPQMILVAAGRDRSKSQFSQELRVATNGDGRISAVGGAYYWRDSWSFQNFTDFILVPQNAGAKTRGYEQETRSIDLFGQVTFKATDEFWLTGGLRYENYRKEGSYDGVQILRTLQGGQISGNTPFAPFSVQHSEDYVDFSIQAQYFVTPDFQLYGSFATGSKGFGFVREPTSNPNVPIANPLFPSEQSETWEAGFKWTIGRSGRLNAAYYHTSIRDFQFAFLQNLVQTVRTDQVRSTGFEIDASYELVPGLTASLTATYADVKKTVPVAGAIPGLILSPKWSGIGDVSYRTALSNDFDLKANVTVEFRSSQMLSDVAALNLSDPARARTDIRIATVYKPLGLELAFVARNIFDVYGVSWAFPAVGTVYADEMPRTIGVQARINF